MFLVTQVHGGSVEHNPICHVVIAQQGYHINAL